MYCSSPLAKLTYNTKMGFSKIFVIWAILACTVSTGTACNMIWSQPFGGSGGTPFSDWATGRADAGPITAITVSYGSHVDGIRVIYGGKCAEHHGGFGSFNKTVSLFGGEYITAVSGNFGWYVNNFVFTTNLGRQLGPIGGMNATPFTYRAPPGYKLRCIAGKKGRYLESISFGWTPV